MCHIYMASYASWIKAARLRTLPLAIANISMGGILAFYFGHFSTSLFALILFTALALQVLSNFANDYGDSVSGVDGDQRDGPQRAIQSGEITQRQMLRAMLISAILAFVSGLLLIYLSPLSVLAKGSILALGLLCIWAAIRYTAGDNPYGYRALGDVAVFIFFGLVSVVGTYYVMSADIRWDVFLPAISCGVFSMAVLNINNVRDIESDRIAGKRSLAMIMGRDRAVIYHAVLLVTGVVAAIGFMLMHYSSPVQLLFLLVVPILLHIQIGMSNEQVDPLLKKMALSTLLFVILFGIGLLI